MHRTVHAPLKNLTGVGTLFLVVGPSGAGKDALIRAARAQFAGREDIVFPHRVITRAADPQAEDHVHVDWETYETMRRDGAFALCWTAYGDFYGVPRDIERDLAEGRDVVVNVSRSIVDAVTDSFPSVRVVWVSADTEVLNSRLRDRAGFTELDQLVRQARAQAFARHGDNVVSLDNSGALDVAVKRFTDVLRAERSSGPVPGGGSLDGTAGLMAAGAWN